jgi:uncharacterized protein (UPF0332 family)
MTDETITALIDYRMEKSRESIKAARLTVNEKMLTFAMNRIYYAMFYAVQAALGKKSISFSKHTQVKGYFNKEFIKSGVLPIDMGRLYNKAFEYRQIMLCFRLTKSVVNSVSGVQERHRGRSLLNDFAHYFS